MIPYIKTLFIKYNEGKTKLLNQANNNSPFSAIDDADSLQNNSVDLVSLSRKSATSRMEQKQ